MDWYLKVLQEYATFTGRARRKEYWMFTLFHIIFFILASVFDVLLFQDSIFDSYNNVGWVYLIYFLATFIPSLAVSVRRLHDTGKSGWWYLINFVPCIGPIWFLVLACTDSEHGSNNWGPNPKGFGNDTVIDQIGTE